MILPDVERPFGVRVKVLDFGAAKLPQALDGRVRTETGVIIGTPAYMSPEQCAGDSAVDGKADVYALGILLFQMLTGSLPFDAKLSFEHLAAHMRKTPQSLRDHLPSAPESLVALVRAMLRKAKTDRPSMPEVAARLEGLLAEPSLAFSLSVRPVAAEGLTPPPLKPSQRTRRRFLLSSALLAFLGAVTVLSLLHQSRARHSASSLGHSETSPPVQRTVRWEVVSSPPGADVVSGDAKLLGSTPWSVERLLAPGQTTLTLRHPGYADAVLILQNHQSATRAIALAPMPVPAETPTAATAPSSSQLPAPPPAKAPAEPTRDKPSRTRAKRSKSDVEVKLMLD